MRFLVHIHCCGNATNFFLAVLLLRIIECFVQKRGDPVLKTKISELLDEAAADESSFIPLEKEQKTTIINPNKDIDVFNEQDTVFFKRAILKDDDGSHFGMYNIIYTLFRIVEQNGNTYYKKRLRYRLISKNTKSCKRFSLSDVRCFPYNLFMTALDSDDNVLEFWEIVDNKWDCGDNREVIHESSLSQTVYENTQVVRRRRHGVKAWRCP